MSDRDFFVTANGEGQVNLPRPENDYSDPNWSSYNLYINKYLSGMDGVDRWSIDLSTFNKGVDAYNSPGWFKSDTFLQAGGRSSEMVVQLLRKLSNGEEELVNLGHAPVDLSTPPEKLIIHGRAWTKVYPQEVWTAEEAIPLFRSFYETLDIPSGVYERPFDSTPGDYTGLVEELSGQE